MQAGRKRHDAIDWQAVRDRLNRSAQALEEAQRLSPERVRAILEARARAAARIPEVAPVAEAVIEVVRFTLGAERYALETTCVREILRSREITSMPGAPDFLVGVTNLRGQIVAVFDLRRYFGIPAPDATDLARVIVLGRERIEFGVLADAVHEVALLRLDQISEPPESVAGLARSFLRGVTAEALIVLDAGVLLDDPRLFIDLGEDAGLHPDKEQS